MYAAEHVLLNRLRAMDDGDTQSDCLDPPPRVTYCCDARYGLPGGSRTLTLDLEDIWEHVRTACLGTLSLINTDHITVSGLFLLVS